MFQRKKALLSAKVSPNPLFDHIQKLYTPTVLIDYTNSVSKNSDTFNSGSLSNIQYPQGTQLDTVDVNGYQFSNSQVSTTPVTVTDKDLYGEYPENFSIFSVLIFTNDVEGYFDTIFEVSFSAERILKFGIRNLSGSHYLLGVAGSGWVNDTNGQRIELNKNTPYFYAHRTYGTQYDTWVGEINGTLSPVVGGSVRKIYQDTFQDLIITQRPQAQSNDTNGLLSHFSIIPQALSDSEIEDVFKMFNAGFKEPGGGDGNGGGDGDYTGEIKAKLSNGNGEYYPIELNETIPVLNKRILKIDTYKTRATIWISGYNPITPFSGNLLLTIEGIEFNFDLSDLYLADGGTALYKIDTNSQLYDIAEAKVANQDPQVNYSLTYST